MLQTMKMTKGAWKHIYSEKIQNVRPWPMSLMRIQFKFNLIKDIKRDREVN